MTQKQQIENHRELSARRIVVLGGSSGIGLASGTAGCGSRGNGNHCVKQCGSS
jgi:hypothetical protein